MGLALGQPAESNVNEDIYASADQWFNTPSAGSSGTSGSILDAILQTGAGIVSAITQPDVVKATLNKYVFGSTNPIPATGTLYPGQPGYVAPQMIPGVSNTYLLIGGLGILLLVMKKRGRA